MLNHTGMATRETYKNMVTLALNQDLSFLLKGLKVKVQGALNSDVYYDETRFVFCLDRVNLSEAGHLYPSEISGGMMKRAAIARAIALNPKYLFCDEPNSGLDPKTSLIIDDLIHDITAEYKMTTIINTHDMNSVMNIGENIIFIKEGVKEWQGNSKEVITSKNKALNDFIFASDLFRKVKEVEEEELKEEELKAK